MPDAQPNQPLHLPSLVIKNFRGIDELTIPRLGRVTLLAGKNGVGKTTVLDAVQIYAARGRRSVLASQLFQRDEVIAIQDQYGEESIAPDWNGLFYGRHHLSDKRVSIGTITNPDLLALREVPVPDEVLDEISHGRPYWFMEEKVMGLEIQVEGSRRTLLPHGMLIPRHLRYPEEDRSLPPEIAYELLGPDLPTNFNIGRRWIGVALTSHEQRAVEALNLVTNSSVERVSIINPGEQRASGAEQHAIVLERGKETPIPLRSLGDGAVRTFALALALANSSGGFLLIDEAENGIHHTIQPKFWKMVLQTAERNNVQVLATTHNWDCVKGFAQAANELEGVEGLLVRIERVPIGLRAITYDESRLDSIVKYGIEAR